MKAKYIFIMAVLVILLALTIDRASASSFPSNEYPGNMYGMESQYYAGPWGEHIVYGSYGYFPNFNGYQPYGYRTYGYMYTPNDIRYGTTMNPKRTYLGNSYNSYW